MAIGLANTFQNIAYTFIPIIIGTLLDNSASYNDAYQKINILMGTLNTLGCAVLIVWNILDPLSINPHRKAPKIIKSE